MKIVVLGADGQLGRSIRKVAVEYPQHAFSYADLPEWDITDEARMEELVKGSDAVINCAAYTAVDRAESEEGVARAINVGGVEILAKACARSSARLIHVSTDYVFDGEGCTPLKESDAVSPMGVYGRTKLEGEQAVVESGCEGAVVRTSWLYSEFGANFVKTMLRVGAQGDALKVVYDQMGSPTYATDLARALIKVAESDTKGVEVYHYSNEGAISWYDFACVIFRLSGMDVKVEAIESGERATIARRPSYSVMSKGKIKKIGVAVPFWIDSLTICLKELGI